MLDEKEDGRKLGESCCLPVISSEGNVPSITLLPHELWQCGGARVSERGGLRPPYTYGASTVVAYMASSNRGGPPRRSEYCFFHGEGGSFSVDVISHFLCCR